MENINFKYKATLNYLFSQLPMFQRIGAAAFKKDLSNTIALCKVLGEPQNKFPSIHIAGTNGKGSTAHMLAAILQSAGYKTGLYTSPHYKDFRERIKVNGKYISKKFVVDFVENYQQDFERIKPSFFEITVALAFDYFATKKVDIAIIETGLGGRLDSTNVVHPMLSIITNISFDHQQFLGDTLPEIAGEKAGIIKNEVPVVIGERQEETASVFENVALQKDAPLFFASDHFVAELIERKSTTSIFNIKKDKKKWLSSVELSTTGPYQNANLATVFQSVVILNGNNLQHPINEPAIRQGLANLQTLVRFRGRWQWLSDNPRVLCDSAHNTSGLQLAMQGVAEIPHKKLHLVIGMVNDKDITKLLQQLPKNGIYYFAKPDIPRGLAVNDLTEQAAKFGLHGRKYSSVRNALRAAKRQAGNKDLIYVGGSTFVVAEVVK